MNQKIELINEGSISEKMLSNLFRVKERRCDMSDKKTFVPDEIMLEQFKILLEESKKEKTTAFEKVAISQAMAALYKAIIG